MKKVSFAALTWRFLTKRTRIFFISSIFLMPLIALAELIQIFTIVPMVNRLLGSEEAISFAGYTIDISLLNIAIFFAWISIVVSILRFVGIYTFNSASLKALEDISTSIYKQRLYGDFSVERGRRASDTMNLFSNKIIYFSAGFIFPLMTIFQSIIIVLAIIVFLMYNIAEIFLLLAASITTLYAVYTYISRSQTKRNAALIKSTTQQHAAKVADLSQNLRELKLYGREKLTLTKFQEIERKLRDREISVQVIAHGSKPIVEGMSFVSLALVIIFAVQAGYQDLIPKLAMLAFGVQKLLPATQQIYSSYSLMVSGKEINEEIFRTLSELETSIVKIESFRPNGQDVSLVDKVIIENIVYEKNGETPLKYPNHEFRLGELNLIAGKSGSGKTTLTDIITGLLQPSDGKIEFSLNGKKIKSKAITFAYCSQSPVIFDDDLSFFSDKTTAQKILKEAVDLNFLKNKTQLHVGILSGGEKQRIGIARALVSQSKIYIFDEPTASLDKLNASLLIKKLESFALSNLVIVVSHDPRLISSSTNMLNLN